MADYTPPKGVIVTTPQGEKRVTLSQIKNMPMALFMQNMDYIEGANRRFYHDIMILQAGTPQAAGQEVDLFRNGIGQPGRVWNTGAAFRKADFHTNMFESGHFEGGVSVIVTAFELLYIALPAKAAVAGTGDSVGMMLDTADHASQPTGYNPLAFSRALMLQNNWRFHRGARQTEEEGVLIDVPSSVGLSASFGGGATFALVQNAFGGVSVALKKPKILSSLEPFFLRLTAQSALLQPVDTVALWRMDCLEIRDGYYDGDDD